MPPAGRNSPRLMYSGAYCVIPILFVPLLAARDRALGSATSLTSQQGFTACDSPTMFLPEGI